MLTSRRARLRLALGLAGAAVLGASFVGVLVRPAMAQSVGPRISPARVNVESLIPPGSAADLPALVVRNEGDAPLDVVMGASADDPALVGWVSFDPSIFPLAPGEARVVNVRIAVPKDAIEGAQRLRLRATTTTPVSSSGVGLGFAVAVATVVDFTVGWPASGLASEPAVGGLDAGGPSNRDFAVAVGVALVAGVAGYLITGWARELEFRSPVTRRRRRPDQDPDE